MKFYSSALIFALVLVSSCLKQGTTDNTEPATVVSPTVMTCGFGTHMEKSECLPDDDIVDCGEDTVLDQNGVCQMPDGLMARIGDQRTAIAAPRFTSTIQGFHQVGSTLVLYIFAQAYPLKESSVLEIKEVEFEVVCGGTVATCGNLRLQHYLFSDFPFEYYNISVMDEVTVKESITSAQNHIVTIAANLAHVRIEGAGNYVMFTLSMDNSSTQKGSTVQVILTGVTWQQASVAHAVPSDKLPETSLSHLRLYESEVYTF